MEGRERLRLFVALVLPEDARDRLAKWQEDVFPTRSGVRPVPRANLHVTLAFLGHRPSEDIPKIMEDMQAAARAAGELVLVARKYRETSRVGMVVLDDQGPVLKTRALAVDVQRRMQRQGVPLRERSPWISHVTVLRFSGASPHFAPSLPELGAVSPSEVALYHSRLRPSGAQYEILESFPLGG